MSEIISMSSMETVLEIEEYNRRKDKNCIIINLRHTKNNNNKNTKQQHLTGTHG